MKPVKMLGLAALAALMAMAFIGAPAAMAESTSFCNIDPGEGPEEVCPAGHLITHLHGVTGGGVNVAVLTSFLTVECEVLYLADTAQELASPIVLKGSFTYGNCAGGCSITEENGPSQIKVLKEGHEKGSAVLEFLMHVKCGSSLDCSYIGNGMKGIFKGGLLPFGEAEEFEAATLTKEAGGFLCPKTSFLDLLVLSLGPFHITR